MRDYLKSIFNPLINRLHGNVEDYERVSLERSIVTPANFVDSFNQLSNVRRIPTDTLVFCYSDRILISLLKKGDQSDSKFPRRPDFNTVDMGVNNPHRLYLVKKDEGTNNFGIVQIGPGASNIAILAEEYYALGFRKFVSIGAAGHIYKKSPVHEIGDLVVPSEALSYDSATLHYAQPNLRNAYFELARQQRAKPTDSLVSRIEKSAKEQRIEIKRTRVVTMGALYRETPSFAKEVTGIGTNVVDMESCALYVVINHLKGAEAASVLWIGDRYPATCDGKWSPAFNSNATYAAERKAINLFLDAVDKRPLSQKTQPIHNNPPFVKVEPIDATKGVLELGKTSIDDPNRVTYYSLDYASKLIGCSPRTLKGMEKIGCFRDVFMPGWISKGDIEALIERQKLS